MAKYNKEKIAECEAWIEEHGLIDYGGAKLKDYVKEVSIDQKTHRLWMEGKPEYKEAVLRAKQTFKNNLTHDLAASLAEVAKGYEREEVEQEYRQGPDGNPIPYRMKKVKKYYPPNLGAAIFLITNLDPEHYVNRQRTDIAFKKDDDTQMTLDEVNAEIDRLNKLDKQ